MFIRRFPLWLCACVALFLAYCISATPQLRYGMHLEVMCYRADGEPKLPQDGLTERQAYACAQRFADHASVWQEE